MAEKKIKKTTQAKATVKKTVKKKTASSRSASTSTSSRASKLKFTMALTGKKIKPAAAEAQPVKAKESFAPQAKVQPTTATLQPRFVFQDNYSLPSNYDASNVTLLARDPYWIYAYWEIAPSSIEELRKKIGDQVNHAKYVLRIYEVSFINFNGSNANHSFDIDIGPFTNSWYINLMSDNGAYCAELGLRTHDGSFYKIARSNYINTPRAVSSHRSDLVWMEVKEKEDPLAYIELRSRKNGAKPRQLNIKTRRVYLSDAEIAAYYSRHFYLLKQILANRLSQQELDALNASFEGGGGGGIDTPFSLDEILQGKFTHRQFLKKIRSGSSDEMIIEEGASVREVVKKRGFYFEIGTELIVYGRTEPDAKVTLEGKEIKLRSDGTFSLRYVLNDTKIPLGFKAYSSNGIDKRSITTAVERYKTHYRDNA